ncbi:MAG: hypothetical protein GF331_22185 [Chitinivibrionales bacterium]|nr:hypothetical protein [Chitinivibrionales bacterium]
MRAVHNSMVALAALVAAVHATPEIDTVPSVVIQEYFEELESGFREYASARVVSAVKLSTTDRHFVDALEEYPGMHSLLRTNSKGIVINEVVRGEQPQRVYRSIAGQRWYRTLRQTWREHRGKIVDRTGRTYLLWAQPIIISKSSGAQRFGGAVLVKIDLFECFSRIAKASEYPFKVLIDGEVFYVHRWEESEDAEEVPISIPGVDTAVVIEIRVSPEPVQLPAADFVEPEELEDVMEADSADTAHAVMPPPRQFPTGRVLLALTLVWLVVWFVRARVRHRRILREVYRDEPS